MNVTFNNLLVVTSLLVLSCSYSERPQKRFENIEKARVKECDKTGLFKSHINVVVEKSIGQINETIQDVPSYELWQLISFYSYKDEVVQADTKIKKTFDEKDLKENLHKIFSKEFVICLERIDFPTLFSKREHITQNYSINEDEVCRVLSTYDNITNQITLVLMYDFFEDGNKYESSINYTYTITNDCTLEMTSLLIVN